MTRRCIVTGCEAEATARRRMCTAHWHRLPGRMRSRLSLSAGFCQTGITDEQWDRARIWLELGPI